MVKLCGCGQEIDYRNNYCKQCHLRERNRLTIEAFWEHVLVTDGCWEWQGKIHPNGYGMLNWFGKKTGAHRVSYLLANGPIPDGLCVCHRCDYRRCVRPDHFFLGTKSANTIDMHRKQRNVHGERQRMARLDQHSVIAIRSAHRDGESAASIARRLNLSASAIQQVVTYHTWKHVV